MASEIPKGYLSLRPGKFTRSTRATTEYTSRELSISNCLITRWDSDLEGDVKRPKEPVSIVISEIESSDPRWEEEPDKIAAFSRDDELSIIAFLTPQAFAQFWAAVDAPYGTTHNIYVTYKAVPPQVYPVGSPPAFNLTTHIVSVTDLGLNESTPASSVHPVVGELRSMREQLKGLTRTLIFAFCVWIVSWFLLSLFR